MGKSASLLSPRPSRLSFCNQSGGRNRQDSSGLQRGQCNSPRSVRNPQRKRPGVHRRQKCNSPRSVRNPQLVSVCRPSLYECNSPRSVRNPQRKRNLPCRRVKCNSPRSVRNPQLISVYGPTRFSVTHQGLSAIHNLFQPLRGIFPSVTHQGLSAIHNRFESGGIHHLV